MDETEQDKSEQPTSFKLQRARRKGTVARGMDLGFLTSLAAFLGYAWMTGPQFGQTLAEAARRALISSATLADGHYAVLGIVAMLFSVAAKPVAFLAGTIFVVVLLFEIVQTGVVFSGEPLKPDFSRLNPAKGLKRIFSLRMLIETGKNILKLAVYVLVGGLVIRGALQSGTGVIGDASGLAALMARTAFQLLAAFALTAAFFAVLDQAIVRRDFLKKMRMSRREVRREMRDREGEPRLKQKRKQLHAEFVKQSQSLRNLRGADVLVTNPEHIALALRYEPATMHAPLIVSMGINHLARRLKRLAFIYSIPIIENRALARELYRRAGLNTPVPEQCFAPVADIYNHIRRTSGAGKADQGHAG